MNGRSEFSIAIAQALVVMLLIGGLPLLTGLIVVRTDGLPALTLNICHPLPGLNHGSGFSAVPLVKVTPALGYHSGRSAAIESPTLCVIPTTECPDTPPPKALT